ncbi:hypothetical protein [Amycolatopsis thermoflava]|uniref:hypothetical protein n=1 Tax=Amycolatopsis thermoflava TaxID=84480 RepID=UPI00042104D5|nr:hypothetical protein [Amycolatopsis thermoflava]
MHARELSCAVIVTATTLATNYLLAGTVSTSREVLVLVVMASTIITGLFWFTWLRAADADQLSDLQEQINELHEERILTPSPRQEDPVRVVIPFKRTASR